MLTTLGTSNLEVPKPGGAMDLFREFSRPSPDLVNQKFCQWGLGLHFLRLSEEHTPRRTPPEALYLEWTSMSEGRSKKRVCGMILRNWMISKENM